jgi:hypothetical protein
MGPLIGFALSPPGRLILCGVGFALLLWLAIADQRRDAAQEAIAAVERGNAEAGRAADAGEMRVLTCPPELWSRERRECATKLR